MKKIVSIVLILALMASVAVISAMAESYSLTETYKTVEDAVKEAGVTETRRYYFMMPDGVHGRTDPATGEVAPSWYNEYNATTGAGIYWWGGSAACTDWCGYAAMKGDAENVYYADVPVDVTTIIWDNGINGGNAPSKEEDDPDYYDDIYFKAAQSINVNSEFLGPGEDVNWPNGIPEEIGFDNKIFIIYPEEVSINDFSQKQTCGGHWFYYYGAGCYGLDDPAAEGFDAAESCQNPDHDHSAPQYVLGDADKDGTVSIFDATKIQRYLAELLESEDEIDLQAAKVVDPEAETPSIYDATRIQRYLAELCLLDGSDWPADAE